MSAWWRSLRVRIAVLGWVAIYVPVLLVFGVMVATEDETSIVVDGVEVVQTTPSDRSPWTTFTVVALGPIAAGVAWWLAGRAVRPIERVRSVAEEIEATDLSRRIELQRGPAEVVSLADSFDAMLDRLQNAADAQRQLIEQTSHDLRTPLSVLTMNADVLLRHPDPTIEIYRDGILRTRAAATRMQSTIDDLLVDARGRARAIDHLPVDLAALLRGVVGDVGELAAAKHIAVSVDGPDAAPCAIDATSVRRALTNLIDNAVRYSPFASTVEVQLEIDDERARVVVADHGPGIAEVESNQVFERHWRGSADSHGTGLGLPIARQVAVAHGGDVTVRSPGPAGNGSVFTLTLRR